MKINYTKIATLSLSLLMMFGGVSHFIQPTFYDAFIPDTLPKLLINYLSGLVEFSLGVTLLLARYRYMSAVGILLLMFAFLPLHLIDVFKEHPAIGSKTLAYIRLPMQIVLIVWAWWVKQIVSIRDSS